MKSLLLATTLGASALALVPSCAPLHDNAFSQNDHSPVYTMPGERTSGGNFTGFAPSHPSAHGNHTSDSGPC